MVRRGSYLISVHACEEVRVDLFVTIDSAAAIALKYAAVEPGSRINAPRAAVDFEADALVPCADRNSITATCVYYGQTGVTTTRSVATAIAGVYLYGVLVRKNIRRS